MFREQPDKSHVSLRDILRNSSVLCNVSAEICVSEYAAPSQSLIPRIKGKRSLNRGGGTVPDQSHELRRQKTGREMQPQRHQDTKNTE